MIANGMSDCLRAVLIHRGLKHSRVDSDYADSLRAVLIHRGLKPTRLSMHGMRV